MPPRDYVLLSNLGSGGTAEVFKAEDVATGDLSTLKVFHPSDTDDAPASADRGAPQAADSEWLTLAMREVALGQALSSPVWVETQGLFEIVASRAPSPSPEPVTPEEAAALRARAFDELTPVSALALRHPAHTQPASGVGQLALLRRHVEGASLADALHGWGLLGAQLPPEACMHAVYRVAGALAELHNLHLPPTFNAGALHGDVSPHNLLVDKGGVTFITDLGHAMPRRLEAPEKGQPPAGKLAYLAPEQLKGSGPTTTAEIYALGIVLWEALTMHRLFKAESDQETWARLQTRRVDPPSVLHAAVPPHLDTLVLAMLAENPSDRPQTMEEVQRALAALGGAVRHNLPAPPPPQSARRASSKHAKLTMHRLALGLTLTLRPASLSAGARSGPQRALASLGERWPWLARLPLERLCAPLSGIGLPPLQRRTRALALAAASVALLSASAWWLGQPTASPASEGAEASAPTSPASRTPAEPKAAQGFEGYDALPALPPEATDRSASRSDEPAQDAQTSAAREGDAPPAVNGATSSGGQGPATAATRTPSNAEADARNKNGEHGAKRTPRPVAREAQRGPAAPRPSGQGDATLVIAVVPWGRIWLDGRELGPSPQTLSVPPGTHRIAYGADAPDRSRVVKVSAGETQSLVLTRDKSGDS